MCFLQVFADFLSFVVNFWPGDDFLGGSSAKTSIFPYNFLERQSCQDPYLSIRISSITHLAQPLWAQLRGPVSRASQREASAHQGDGCWLPVTLASLRRARAKGAAGRRGWSARESHQEESAQRGDTGAVSATLT